ncbi:MAG: AAA family ATPase, partial [Thermoplasmata archaeon]
MVEVIKKRLLNKPVSRGDKVPISILNYLMLAQISKTTPRGVVTVVPETRIFTTNGQIEEIGITYDDIGGLKDEIKRLREVVEYPLKYPEVFGKLGIEAPKGVLLYGPPGTGKTLLAKALSHELKAKFFMVQGPEILSNIYAESEARLRNLFEDAKKKAPSIIFIDEIDSIAGKRDTANESERRLVAQMLALLDGMEDRGKITVIAATNRVHALDMALRRPGRFETEIYLGVPNADARREILKIHAYKMPLEDDFNLEKLVEKTKGYVGADIASLCREAAYNCIRRVFTDEQLEQGDISFLQMSQLKVSQSDFEEALKKIKPSALRELIIEIPKTKWEDIGGLEEIKKLLKENVEYAFSKRESFEKMGIKPVKGILLHGAPGTGKTLLARAVASECGANFITVKGPEIFSKWLGESEENIRFTFAKAREVAPCIIFFDEIDAVAPTRGMGYGGSGENAADRVVNQILTEMDGIQSLERVIVIAATNRLDMVDKALLRPGRFDYLLEIPLPDPPMRKKIFEIHLRDVPLSTDVTLDALVHDTEGLAGSDIMAICREAALEALRENNFVPQEVKMKHLRQGFERIMEHRKKMKTADLEVQKLYT